MKETLMENEELPFKDRYVAILRAYDYTPAELASKLNKPIAPFYKYRTGEIAMPRKDVLEKMLILFPGLRKEYLFYGQGPMKQATFIAPMEPDGIAKSAQTSSDQEDWKAIALKALSDRDELIKELAKVNEEQNRLLTRLLIAERPDLFIDQEGVKMPSSSQTTANEYIELEVELNKVEVKPEPIGYKLSYMKIDCKVLPLWNQPTTIRSMFG